MDLCWLGLLLPSFLLLWTSNLSYLWLLQLDKSHNSLGPNYQQRNKRLFLQFPRVVASSICPIVCFRYVIPIDWGRFQLCLVEDLALSIYLRKIFGQQMSTVGRFRCWFWLQRYGYCQNYGQSKVHHIFYSLSIHSDLIAEFKLR